MNKVRGLLCNEGSVILVPISFDYQSDKIATRVPPTAETVECSYPFVSQSRLEWGSMPWNKVHLARDSAGDWSHSLRGLSAAGPDGLATAMRPKRQFALKIAGILKSNSCLRCPLSSRGDVSSVFSGNSAIPPKRRSMVQRDRS